MKRFTIAMLVVVLGGCGSLGDLDRSSGGSGGDGKDAGTGGDDRGRCTLVFDGETIQVRIGGKKEKVRLLGVDAPEPPGKDGGGEWYGAQAMEFVRAELEGRKVGLVFGSDTRRDRFGRLLAYVHRGGKDFCAQLIRKGYALSDDRYPHPKERDYDKLEREARKGRRGLWAK